MFKHSVRLFALISVLVSGCSSVGTIKPPTDHSDPLPNTPNVKADVIAADECRFPFSSEKAPSWVCDAPIEGVALSAPGMSEKSPAGYQFMKTMAAANAREQLASQLRVRVTNMVKQYVETVGIDKHQRVDRVLTTVSKHITDETLVGSKIIRTMPGPKDQLWVLVGIDEQTLRHVAKSAISAGLASDPESQRLRGAGAQTELAEAIVANSLATKPSTPTTSESKPSVVAASPPVTSQIEPQAPLSGPVASPVR